MDFAYRAPLPRCLGWTRAHGGSRNEWRDSTQSARCRVRTYSTGGRIHAPMLVVRACEHAGAGRFRVRVCKLVEPNTYNTDDLIHCFYYSNEKSRVK
jgi:hypothetical protein